MAHPKVVPDLYFLTSEGVWAANFNGVRKRFGSDRPAAEQAYRRFVAEWLVIGEAALHKQVPDSGYPTVLDALTRYLQHLQGKVSESQAKQVGIAMQVVSGLYGAEATDKFDQLSLQAVRESLKLSRDGRGVGRCAGQMVELLLRGPMRGTDLDATLRLAGFSDSMVSKTRTRLGVVRYREGSMWMARLPDGFTPPSTRPLSRGYINSTIRKIQTAWTWLVSQKFAPDGSDVALRSVRSLRAHQGGRETPRSVPVAPSVVEAILPHCSRIIRAMITVQQLTGMRPGEVCAMRPRDISRSPDCPIRVPVGDERFVPLAAQVVQDKTVWVYAPASHKTLWKERPRVIPLGPKAQEILLPFVDGRESDAYLFSPREAMEEYCERVGRRKKFGKSRKPGERYTSDSYRRAIERHARKAKVGFTPYQLRHALATFAANESDDPGVAQAMLGHSTPDTTAIYVQHLFRKAAGFAADNG